MSANGNPYESPQSKGAASQSRMPLAVFVIAAVGNVLAALAALAYLRYPPGSDPLFVPEDIAMLPIGLLTALSWNRRWTQSNPPRTKVSPNNTIRCSSLLFAERRFFMHQIDRYAHERPVTIERNAE